MKEFVEDASIFIV